MPGAADSPVPHPDVGRVHDDVLALVGAIPQPGLLEGRGVQTAPSSAGWRLMVAAASMPVPGYAIDDQTAIKVTDGTIEVVSEGHWKLIAR